MEPSHAHRVDEVIGKQNAGWTAGSPPLVLGLVSELEGLPEEDRIVVVLNEIRWLKKARLDVDLDAYGRVAVSLWPAQEAEIQAELDAPPISPTPDAYPTIPGYLVDRLLASGGTSDVYLARRDGATGWFAIKVLRSTSDEDRAQFLAEFDRLSRMKDPHIVTVFHDGQVTAGDGLLFYVMEFLEGGPLTRHVKSITPMRARDRRERERRERLCAEVVLQAARAVLFLFDNRVFHADLKLANLLLLASRYDRDRTGPAPRQFDADACHLRLTDFGQAVDMDESGRAAATSRSTRPFTAPERWSAGQDPGAPRYVTEKTEVYSLGRILFQLLTGLPDGQLPDARPGEPILTKEQASLLSTELADCCETCCRWDPNERPTLRPLIDRLEKFCRPDRPAVVPRRVVLAPIAVMAILSLLSLAGVAIVGERVIQTLHEIAPPMKEASAKTVRTPEDLRRVAEVEKKIAKEEPLTTGDAFFYLRSRIDAYRRQPTPVGLEAVRMAYRSLAGQAPPVRDRFTGLLRLEMGVACFDLASTLPERDAGRARLFREALGYFADALGHDDGLLPSLHNNMAWAHVELGQADAALPHAEQAIILSAPDDKVLHTRYDTALQAYVLKARLAGAWREVDRRRALQIATELPRLYRRAGQVHRAVRALAVIEVLAAGLIPGEGMMRSFTKEELP
jgi:serine/threonine protein kinase